MVNSVNPVDSKALRRLRPLTSRLQLLVNIHQERLNETAGVEATYISYRKGEEQTGIASPCWKTQQEWTKYWRRVWHTRIPRQEESDQKLHNEITPTIRDTTEIEAAESQYVNVGDEVAPVSNHLKLIC